MKRRTAAAVLLALAALLPAGAAFAAARPSISARSAVLIEPSSGRTVYSRNPYSRREIASTTKMMTALLLLERRSLSHRIRVLSYNGSSAESSAGLIPGERLTSADMLRALLLASANEAAASIAVDVGGSRSNFVRMMNRRAAAAGLRGTHYANPIGLDSGQNYSTARDLTKLAVLLRTKRFARQLMDRSKATLHSGSRTRTVYNKNTLIGTVPWMNGVKTGHTQRAGYILVGSATRNGVELISAVTGEPSEAARNSDTLKLMRYGFARYRSVTAVQKDRQYATVAVSGRSEKAKLVAASSAAVVVRRGTAPTLVISDLPSEIKGPLRRGTEVGFIIVRRAGKTADRVPLVTASAVAAPTLLSKIAASALPLTGALIILALLAVAATLLRRGRRSRRREAVRREPA